MEPTETKALKPTISLRLQSSTAVHSAPLWLMKPTEPGRAMVVAKVAFRPESGLITPRQLGPTTRMLAGLRLVQQLALQRRALRPDFLEAGRNHDRAAHAVLAAFPDDSGNRGRRRHDHRQVHLLRDVRDGLVGLHAQHAGPLGVHGIDGAAERAGHQVPQHRSSDGVGVFGRADDGDGLGGEEYIQGLIALMAQLLSGRFSRLHDLAYPPLVRPGRFRASTTSGTLSPFLRAMISISQSTREGSNRNSVGSALNLLKVCTHATKFGRGGPITNQRVASFGRLREHGPVGHLPQTAETEGLR